MTIDEAVKKGINKIKKSNWVNKNDYLLLDIVDGVYGPWGHLYSSNNELIGNEDPVNILLLNDNSNDWEEFKKGA
jgi:hypothetical protein